MHPKAKESPTNRFAVEDITGLSDPPKNLAELMSPITVPLSSLDSVAVLNSWGGTGEWTTI
jgi:hypothetical protein